MELLYKKNENNSNVLKIDLETQEKFSFIIFEPPNEYFLFIFFIPRIISVIHANIRP